MKQEFSHTLRKQPINTQVVKFQDTPPRRRIHIQERSWPALLRKASNWNWVKANREKSTVNSTWGARVSGKVTVELVLGGWSFPVKEEGGHSRQRDWQMHRHGVQSRSHLSWSQLGWGCQEERKERRAETRGWTYRIWRLLWAIVGSLA